MRPAQPSLDAPTQRYCAVREHSGPDTLSDPICESGVQLCAAARRLAVDPEPSLDDLEAALEPGEITLVSIYDGTGLQHPEDAPLVEVVSDRPDVAALSSELGGQFAAPELDLALASALGVAL